MPELFKGKHSKTCGIRPLLNITQFESRIVIEAKKPLDLLARSDSSVLT